MPNSITKIFSLGSWWLEASLVGLYVMLSIGASEAKPITTKELQTTATPQLVFRAEAFGKDSRIIPRGKLPEVDGLYLYGQSPEPEQLGQEYMVFEAHHGKVVGAFYLPRSEFSCFHGTLESGKLAVMIADDPGSAPYSDPVADDQNSPKVATASDSSHIGDSYGQIASPYSVALQNYHQLPSVSANDQRILAACKNQFNN